MILRVSLRHWRSYESLELSLKKGTIFVVAPNGVGKTSLILGLAWGVFGDHAGIEPRRCIRAGADRAEVSVAVRLNDGRELTVTRVIGRRGRPQVTGSIADQGLTGDEVERLLEESFQVDMSVAARLSLMLGGQHLSSETALNLKSHLHKAFGVEEVLRAAEVTQRMVKEAEKQRAALREHEKRQSVDRQLLEVQLTGAMGELSGLVEERSTLEADVRAALEDRALAREGRAKAEARTKHEAELRLVIDNAGEVLGLTAVDQADLEELVETRCQEVAERTAALGQAMTSARVALAAAKEALRLLAGETGMCPTCLKPIHGDELSSAREEHERRHDSATEELEGLEEEEAALQEHAHALSDLKRQIDLLRRSPPPEPTPLDARDPAAAEQAYDAAGQSLQAHDQRIGAIEERVQRIRAEVAADAQVDASERALRVAYRREAISALAAAAFGKAAKEILEELIEPIATEVKFRWKALFPVGGLTLRSDGTIVRAEAGEELTWDCFSDGERIWARIVTHLLVVTSSTRIPFVWFDEPLEHLDPQLRHAVAATLAAGTEGHRPVQLLVTTYESQLARQLAEDMAGVQLVNVRAEAV
ncbi:MAG TPA: AAA family ATPase [Actinomycetota bacterium]|nr:AAA family ATPase [Actinomycetota bacterium]